MEGTTEAYSAEETASRLHGAVFGLRSTTPWPSALSPPAKHSASAAARHFLTLRIRPRCASLRPPTSARRESHRATKTALSSATDGPSSSSATAISTHGPVVSTSVVSSPKNGSRHVMLHARLPDTCLGNHCHVLGCVHVLDATTEPSYLAIANDPLSGRHFAAFICRGCFEIFWSAGYSVVEYPVGHRSGEPSVRAQGGWVTERVKSAAPNCPCTIEITPPMHGLPEVTP